MYLLFDNRAAASFPKEAAVLHLTEKRTGFLNGSRPLPLFNHAGTSVISYSRFAPASPLLRFASRM